MSDKWLIRIGFFFWIFLMVGIDCIVNYFGVFLDNVVGIDWYWIMDVGVFYIEDRGLLMKIEVNG